MTSAQTSGVRTLAFCLTLLLVAVGCGGGGGEGTDTPPTDEASLPANELAVDNPWVRPAEPGGNSALYLTLANGLSTADTLVSVQAPIIGDYSFHESVDSAGTTQMRSIGPISIAPKTRVTLEPGGRHVMLENLSQPLREGETVLLNVEFARAGLRSLRATISNTPPEDPS